MDFFLVQLVKSLWPGWRKTPGALTQGGGGLGGQLISGHTSTLGSPARPSSQYQLANNHNSIHCTNTHPYPTTTIRTLQRTNYHPEQPRTTIITTHHNHTTTHHNQTTMLGVNGGPPQVHQNAMLGISTPAHLNNLDEEVSYKSFSRDSGHGGSEQEDSPRNQWNNTHQHHHPRQTNSLTSDLKNSYLHRFNRLNSADRAAVNRGDIFLPNTNKRLNQYPYIESENKPNITIPNNYTLTVHPTQGSNVRIMPSYNHTYMEIEGEMDPVYEEIERERWSRINGTNIPAEMMQQQFVPEEQRTTTPSDVYSSRQSSRSYGDHKPLLPYYSQQQQQQMRQQKQMHLPAYQLEQHYMHPIEDFQHNQQQQIENQQQRENLMAVAVLNGEQVVCKLTTSPTSSSCSSGGNGASNSANSPSSPNSSGGYPAHLLISKPEGA